METEIFIEKKDYKTEILNIQKKLRRPYINIFIDKYWPDASENEKKKIRRTFINFMNGNSYISGISPPYYFWSKINEFLKDKDIARQLVINNNLS